MITSLLLSLCIEQVIWDRATYVCHVRYNGCVKSILRIEDYKYRVLCGKCPAINVDMCPADQSREFDGPLIEEYSQ